VTHARETEAKTGAEQAPLSYLHSMDLRVCIGLLACFLLAPCSFLLGQETAGSLIDKVYGTKPERPDGYSFTHVIHYDLVQQVDRGEGKPKEELTGTMDLYYTPGGTAYGRVVESPTAKVSHIGDLERGMRYTLTLLGEVGIGSEVELSSFMKDTLKMSRVSGDKEIEGRMSAHFWYEEGTVIEELWADTQASEEEVAIGRLWPRFEPGFAGLATGNYIGLATRWISIDTQFGREPRMVLDFKGAEKLDEPLEISLEGFVFPVSEADMMRERLNTERQ